MAKKKTTKATKTASVADLQRQIKELISILAAQVHIQSPEDGDPVLQNFTASGSVRPKTHEVQLTLRCMQTGQMSTVTDANVNHSTGQWTAGPFRRSNGNLLDPGSGAILFANSFNPLGGAGDDDNVSNLTIQ